MYELGRGAEGGWVWRKEQGVELAIRRALSGARSKGTVSPASGVILVSAVEPSKLVEKLVLFSQRRMREWSQDCSALSSAAQRMHVPVWEKWDAP